MLTARFSIPESPIQNLSSPLLTRKQIRLDVKRDDLLHPLISGNKWRKLKYNLVEMKALNCHSLVTFGGAFSNHIYATAMASKLYGIEAHAIIRGPHLDAHNPTLRLAHACGMHLHPVDRKTYRRRHEPEYLAELKSQFEHCYFIPEGGTNKYALQGVRELARSLPKSDVVVCATGSGGTLAGLISGCAPTTHVLGVAVLKQADYLKDEVFQLIGENNKSQQWQLLTEFHDGGYGKFSAELWQFCQQMKVQHHLPLEPIYTGKMFYALWQLIEQDYFAKGTHITAIHTGGLQGLDGLRYRGLIPR